MGVVYRARQVSLDRIVALKVLPAATADEKAASRFEREARSMARLSHPNIVDVIEVGEQDGTRYFAMQFIDGEPLDDLIRREGALPPERVAEIGAQVAEALAHAHDAGVIHRDIKPGNIMIDRNGRAIVTDFGIAKAGMADGDAMAMTALTQGPIGSPAYMSPEVLKGNPVDGRADLYGLGIVLFEMATGRVPFSAATAYQVATQQLTEQPPAPRSMRADVPEWLESTILRALAKEPADRFGSAAQMAEALRNKQTTTVAAPTVTPHPGGNQTAAGAGAGSTVVQKKAPSSVPRSIWAIAGGGLAMLAVAAIVFAGGFSEPDPPPPPPSKTVPAVDGMTVSEAQEKLRAVGLASARTSERHDSANEGTVIAQQPSSGASVSPDTTVELTVSLGPDVIAVGEEIEAIYQSIAALLVDHEASNEPWEEWKAIHGGGSASWNRYMTTNYTRLIASDESLVEDYQRLASDARAVAVPDSGPKSFSTMVEILAKGCDAGAERCAKSARLIRLEAQGANPSWGRHTPYGQAKAEHERLLGPTGPIGGRASGHHDKFFYPDLLRLRQQ